MPPPSKPASGPGFVLIAGLLLSLSLLPRSLADVTTEEAATDSAYSVSELAAGTGRLPGVDFAQGIGQITGVAISPLLGVCTVGTWQYFRTPAEVRHLLPWYCHPWVWGVGFCVLLLCFFKDSIGVAAPLLIKKPFDFAELFENKASAIVASAAFVPFVAAQMSAHLQNATPSGAMNVSSDALLLASTSTSASTPALIASLPFDPLWILIPLCVAGFLVVWLVSHAITVLILLSPFGAVDAFLKGVRTAMLGLVVATTLLSPALGAVLSLILIAVAAFLAPCTFRLAFFGSVIAGDYLLSLLQKRERLDPPVYAFLARRGNQTLPARSFGVVERGDDGRLRFCSRWLFFGQQRTIALTESERMQLDRGLLFPSLSQPGSDPDCSVTVIHLLPRHRHHADQVGHHLGIGEVRDNPLVRGFSAMRQWFSDLMRSGRDRWLESTSDEAPLAADAPGDSGR